LFSFFQESISEDAEREWKDLVFRHPGNRVAWEAYISRTKVNTGI